MLKKQIISFILVGIINTIFGYSIYALFIYLGLNYVLASLFSTIIGIFFNFRTIGNFVFKSKNNRLLFKFFQVYIIVFLVNIAIIKLFKSVGLNDYFSGAIAILFASVVSFLLNKYYVFKR